MLLLNILARGSNRFTHFRYRNCLVSSNAARDFSLNGKWHMDLHQRESNAFIKKQLLIENISFNQIIRSKTGSSMHDENAETKEEKLSNKEKLKRAVSAYGSTVIVFHITISLMSLGLCYLIVASGIDIKYALEYLHLGDAITSKLATNAGTFVVAYAIHKVFAPLRIGITLTATPFIVRYLRRIGILKSSQVKK